MQAADVEGQCFQAWVLRPRDLLATRLPREHRVLVRVRQRFDEDCRLGPDANRPSGSVIGLGIAPFSRCLARGSDPGRCRENTLLAVHLVVLLVVALAMPGCFAAPPLCGHDADSAHGSSPVTVSALAPVQLSMTARDPTRTTSTRSPPSPSPRPPAARC